MLSPDMQLMVYKQREKEMLRDIEMQRLIAIARRQQPRRQPWPARFAQRLSAIFHRGASRPAVEAQSADPGGCPDAPEILYPC